MTQGDPFGTDPWHAWREASAAGWGTRGADLGALAAWYRSVAEELRDTILAAPSDPPAFERRLERFAIAFFTGDPSRWPGLGAFGSVAAATIFPGGAAPSAAALGPAREHQLRAAALAAATAELAAARQALVPLLTEAARAAATAFSARAADGAARGARATFDLWIECAEAAWQDLAHGESWCLAQSRAFDAALSVVACQREIAAHAARLAGLPGRDEVDELHRRLRALERDR